MFPITHILLPIVLIRLYSALSSKDVSGRQVLFAGVAGILPDLLNLHIALADRASYSHSILILVPMGLWVIVAAGKVRRYVAILFTGVAAHIVMDIVSNPYNFLYPLQFNPSYPVLSQCGLSPFFCWYLVDLLLVILFVLGTYWSTVTRLARHV